MSWVITGTQKTDPDALAYLAEVERADGQALESGVRDAVIAFVTGCKADGIWNAIKASCILAGARTLTGALVPLVGTAPTNVNFVSGDYNRETGLVGDGSTKYLDSNRNNNADPQNNHHMAVQISTLSSVGNIGYIGAGDTTDAGATRIGTTTASATTLVPRSRNTTPNTQAGGSLAIGFAGISRNTASGYTARGANVNYSITQSSQTPYNGNVYVFAFNGVNQFSNARLAFYSIGESLNLALLDARVTDLINAFGAAIP
jgi:hypothetical protein